MMRRVGPRKEGREEERHVRRVGGQVGGFTLMATSDLKKVAPLWLNYTIAIRYDPDVRPSCFFPCTLSRTCLAVVLA